MLLGHAALETTVIYFHLSQTAHSANSQSARCAFRYQRPFLVNRRPPREVADIICFHGKRFLDQHSKLLDYRHLRVMHAIENCRTAILGGHLDACDRCGYLVICYNFCRIGIAPSVREQSGVAAQVAVISLTGFSLVLELL